MVEKLVPKMKELKQCKLTEIFNISRQYMYYQHTGDLRDEGVKRLIITVWQNSRKRTYGHKRLAIETGLNKKRILRVMNKYHLSPLTRKKKPRKTQDEGKEESVYKNLIIGFCPIVQDLVWAADFTFINFHGKFLYLATVIDIYTRVITGWNMSIYHNQDLVLGATYDAINNELHDLPLYFHSDQGSEYDSRAHTKLLENLGIHVSMSGKQRPWENPFQESFYSNFKLDLGNPNRFYELGQLIEEINLTLNYYNKERIHTTLKMSPVKYRDEKKVIQVAANRSELVV